MPSARCWPDIPSTASAIGWCFLIGAIIIVSGDLLVIAAPTFKLLLICRAITAWVCSDGRRRHSCLFASPPVKAHDGDGAVVDLCSLFCCRSCRTVPLTTLPTGGILCPPVLTLLLVVLAQCACRRSAEKSHVLPHPWPA
ncbi:hypothetical protein DMH17_17135 [Raoultella planticola]|nr:hypothetical protein [Raoultella planticola]